MSNAPHFCPCCEALTPVAGLCWNCQHGRCDVICDTCGEHFGAKRADGSVVDESSEGVTCSRCEPCHHDCGCDTQEKHNDAEAESLRDFLRDPGPPPAHWDAETAERVTASIERERAVRS